MHKKELQRDEEKISVLDYDVGEIGPHKSE